MAVTYNSADRIWYGTNADRLADTDLVATATQKFYEYDTDTLYITDGTNWTVIT